MTYPQNVEFCGYVLANLFTRIWIKDILITAVLVTDITL